MSPELQVAVKAARQAGAFLKSHFYGSKSVNEESQHDIKLQLDVESQKLITEILLEAYPNYAVYGEEGIAGNQESPNHWIVDPIDGTVNFYYGIPHFCVSIALRKEDKLVIGVIYDPMMDELWTVDYDGHAKLNGEIQSVSARERMDQAVVFIGHGKHDGSKQKGLERFARVSEKVRKMRITGSAALAMAYIASGRFDAYVESVISLWDIAAGKLLVEAAGGRVELTPSNKDSYAIVAWNGKIPIREAIVD